MDRIKIIGGEKLYGSIPIAGAKNAALPLMIASLLTPETLVLENVPRLSDVRMLKRILGNHGVDVTVAGKRPGESTEDGEVVRLQAAHIVDTHSPYELVSQMRASFWVLAPLVARMREAKVSLPGGCAIGTRPVDLLLMAMEKLGARLEIEAGYVIASAPDGLKGAEIDFPKVTVGGTHTALMAAVLARGKTVIKNAACEPEVTDLANCLVKMGAKITGIGTPTLEIIGVDQLHGTTHRVLPDRIEAGTYACAVAMTGGDVLLEGVTPDLLQSALDKLKASGTEVIPEGNGIRIRREGGKILPVNITTEVFPGFPTDLQAQFMALMTRADGVSQIIETIFENRFMHVQELARFGAKIRLDGDMALIEGRETLTGAPVMATDLRASVSLVIAALAAQGETMINRVYHLDRGFEGLETKLQRCGAKVERIRG
jgi:UDP-N-acetylglucosamine 1-carboxyvinyltransferase